MSRISPYGKSNGVYMSFQQHLDNHPNKEETQIFLHAQEIGRMSEDPNADHQKMGQILTAKYGSVDIALETFEKATASITKTWEPMTERVDSSFTGLLAHSANKDGIDLRIVENEEGRYGYNGNRGCNVNRGSCSCGAWH